MNPALSLDPHQMVGANWLASQHHAMLAWEPGVGKTPTAVRACVQVDARNILVLCPPIATRVWRDHFREWSDIPLGRVQIIPYSLISARGPDTLHGLGIGHWHVVILDECHNLKNPRSNRTVGTYGEGTDLVDTPLASAGHVWALTGTPLLNHAAEFWSHLHALAPECIKSQAGVMSEDLFVSRYCNVQDTPNGVRILSSKNTWELATRVKPFVDRKRFKDVALGMPDLRIVEYALPEDPDVSGPLRQQLEAVLDAMGTPDLDQMSDDELLAALQTGTVSWSTVRRLIGVAKARGVAELVSDMLDDGLDSKVILFAHHREVITALEGMLQDYQPLVIHGGTPDGAREQAIDRFQKDPRHRLIILAIETAGEAITLHASHNVVLAEFSPVPARNQQAIGRAYRRGQKHPVLARFVLLPGTLDARLMSIIARKTRDIATIVDNQSGSTTTA